MNKYQGKAESFKKVKKLATECEPWNVNTAHLEYDPATTSRWVNAHCVDKPIGVGSKNLLASIPSCYVFWEYASASNPIPCCLLCAMLSVHVQVISQGFADRFPFAYTVHRTNVPYAWKLYCICSRHCWMMMRAMCFVQVVIVVDRGIRVWVHVTLRCARDTTQCSQVRPALKNACFTAASSPTWLLNILWQ